MNCSRTCRYCSAPRSIPRADRRGPPGRYPHVTSAPPGNFARFSGLVIHRLRPGPAREQRAARLASINLQDRRISSGCIVVPGAFFDAVVQPLLGSARGVVYVMPEDGGVGGLVPPPEILAPPSAAMLRP